MRARVMACTATVLTLVACEGEELGWVHAPETGDMSAGAVPRGAPLADHTALCGTGARTLRGELMLGRQPYVQRVAHDEAVVMWSTLLDHVLTLRVFEPGGDSVAELPAYPTGYRYEVAVPGLAPDRLYCYEVLDRERLPLHDPIGFRTAPLPGADEPIAFVSMGDIGHHTDEQLAVAAQLAAVDFDFAIINGDVGYDTGKPYEYDYHFFEVYTELIQSIPFFVVAGGHDYMSDGGRTFRALFALFENAPPAGHEKWYSFDWGPVHVVALDTEALSEAQAQWLERDLAQSDARWTVVFMHEPPYSSGDHGSNTTARRSFSPSFERHGVDLVLAGHDHSYERVRPRNGVHYVVSGAGGRGTHPVGHSPFTAFSARVTHLTYITIAGDTLTLWAVDATGQTFDTLTLSR